MTPLAHEIVKDSLLPVRRRQRGDVMQSLRLLDGVHFFECSAVVTSAAEIGNAIHRSGHSEKIAFLPAPRTWVEWNAGDAGRCALLLEQKSDDEAAVTCVAHNIKSGEPLREPTFYLPLRGHSDVGSWAPSGTLRGHKNWHEFGKLATLTLGLLAMINTPRVIMRQQHMPHAGLQRALIANRKIIGKYPVGAWSELLLKVRPPEIDDTEHEAHLTGARALHFCRAHLRIRLGRLELVSAHWRGDPALGIKKTRYRLAA